ncbi:SsgA family sporulation/cell division regulator [Wenjunlia vitaminophila]|uniref:SsgA family sporulation/cell division regulator n=1 Tax=Wenjunlia vitaminophila TaxID=76728 RepID=UPI00037D7F9C|nr:SsgA family sporulation/cell division regulator [Wenjunlia vitaminophila]
MLTAVRQAIRLEVVSTPRTAVPITAELCYLPEEPYSVHIHLPPATPLGTGTRWTFSRDLLGAGLCRSSHLDGVWIWPVPPEHTRIALEDPDGTVLLQADSSDLLRFLDRSYAAVPAGSERHHGHSAPDRRPGP